VKPDTCRVWGYTARPAADKERVTVGLAGGRALLTRIRRVSARADESGVTLVEILVSVWIVGAVVTAMSAALFTMVRTSDTNNRQALVELKLRH
jgi:hypothetical protein